MFKQISEGLCELACAIRENSKLRESELAFLKSRLATKRDMEDARDQIITAFGERIPAGTIKALADKLGVATDAVESALAKT